MTLGRHPHRSLGIGLLVTLLLSVGPALAFWWYIPHTFYSQHAEIYYPQSYVKTGAVYARTIVPGPEGKPVYVEFDPGTGLEVAEIAEAHEDTDAHDHQDWSNLKVFSAREYTDWLRRFDVLATRYADPDADTHDDLQLEVVTASDYEEADYTTVDGKTMEKPRLASDPVYVVLLPRALRYLPDTPLVLLELPIDPNEYRPPEVRPILGAFLRLRQDHPDLELVEASVYEETVYETVGPDPQPMEQGENGENGENEKPELAPDTLFVALLPEELRLYPNLLLLMLEHFLPPGPGFQFVYKTALTVPLYYDRLTPGKNRRPYILRNDAFDVCRGTGYGVMGKSTGNTTWRTDFPIELMMLSSAAYLTNDDLSVSDPSAILLHEVIAFDYNQDSLQRVAQPNSDFDGDGEADLSLLGRQSETGGALTVRGNVSRQWSEVASNLAFQFSRYRSRALPSATRSEVKSGSNALVLRLLASMTGVEAWLRAN